MSYKKLDEKIGGIAGTGIQIDDSADNYDGDSGNVSNTFLLSGSLSHQEQSDRQASLSEPLTTSTNIVVSDNDKAYKRSYENPSDPYYVFRDDLNRQLEIIDECLAEYLRLVNQLDVSNHAIETKDVKRQLKRYIKNAESTINDVYLTVQVVEKDRAKFVHITDRELYDRTSLVHTSRQRINRTKQEMNSDSVKAKLNADDRGTNNRNGGNNDRFLNGNRGASTAETNGDYDHIQSDNYSNFNNGHSSDTNVRTSLLMQHQEETLDVLGAAVTRVGHMAETIHEEIGQQNKMLTDMEEDLTNVEEELGMVMGKLAKLLKTKDSWQLGTIICLMGTVIILFFLVLYT